MKPHYANMVVIDKGEHRYVLTFDDGRELEANLTLADIGRIMEDINGGKTQV